MLVQNVVLVQLSVVLVRNAGQDEHQDREYSQNSPISSIKLNKSTPKPPGMCMAKSTRNNVHVPTHTHYMHICAL